MSILLAIPCFNEAGRLPVFLPRLLEQIAVSKLPVTVEVVDDGSRQEEHIRMNQLVDDLRKVHPFLQPLRTLPENRGKGGAVHAAWAAACETHGWLAFVDADGSLSPAETCRFLRNCLADPAACSWFASRIKMLGHQIERHFSKHLMGRVFATLVGLMIDSRVYDSQCGLKAVPSSHYRMIRPLLSETRFAFDVELLAALAHAGLEVRELPVDWADVAGSKVKLLRDPLRMFLALLRIRSHRHGWPTRLTCG
jgi:glycosyltransferase involved in cell wall biosynthesis